MELQNIAIFGVKKGSQTYVSYKILSYKKQKFALKIKKNKLKTKKQLGNILNIFKY